MDNKEEEQISISIGLFMRFWFSSLLFQRSGCRSLPFWPGLRSWFLPCSWFCLFWLRFWLCFRWWNPTWLGPWSGHFLSWALTGLNPLLFFNDFLLTSLSVQQSLVLFVISCVESLIDRFGKDRSELKYVPSPFFRCPPIWGYGHPGARSQLISVSILTSFLGRDVACLRLNLVLLRTPWFRFYIYNTVHSASFLLRLFARTLEWHTIGDNEASPKLK